MEGQVRVVLASFLTETEFITGQGNEVSVFIYLGRVGTELSVLMVPTSCFPTSSGLRQIGLVRGKFLFWGAEASHTACSASLPMRIGLCFCIL